MDRFIELIIPIALGLTIGLLFSMRTKKKPNRVIVDTKEAFISGMRKGQLIDLRKQDEASEDKIKGARHFNGRYLKSKHQTKIRKDRPVYLYCKNGKKSRGVANTLVRKGFIEVHVLSGGYDNYLKS